MRAIHTSLREMIVASSTRIQYKIMCIVVMWCLHVIFALLYIGAPTAPDVILLSESSRTMYSITIRANLQQPVYGFQCIQNYTVIARADGQEDVRGVSTLLGNVFVLVSVCLRQYTITAVACSPMLGCSNESSPEIIDVSDGKCTVLN